MAMRERKSLSIEDLTDLTEVDCPNCGHRFLQEGDDVVFWQDLWNATFSTIYEGNSPYFICRKIGCGKVGLNLEKA